MTAKEAAKYLRASQFTLDSLAIARSYLPVSKSNTNLKVKNVEGACIWEEESGYNLWESQCGKMFEFYDDGPVANGFKFCPYCGQKIEEATYEDKYV